MKNVLLLALGFFMLQACSPQITGNGEVAEKRINLQDFDRLRVSGAFTIELRQADRYEVVLVADRNLHEVIELSVHKGILRVSTRESIRKAESLKLRISMPALEGLDFSGATELIGVGNLSGDELYIETSGASEMKLQLAYDNLEIKSSGASEGHLTGRADRLLLQSSGASEWQAEELEVAEARVKMSGASNLRLWVRDNLEVDISGAGELLYRGQPAIQSDISGAATVAPLP